MRREMTTYGAIVLFSGFVAACSSSDEQTEGAGACEPEQQIDCTCSDGSAGTQSCDANGMLTVCTGCGSTEPVDTTDPGDPTIDPVSGYPFCPEDPAAYAGEPCVDEGGAVICKVSTGYPGDELAVCDLPGKLVMHYGPDPSEYDNPDALFPFLLGPGEEDENCMFVHTRNAEQVFLANYHGRLRPQSHHLIATTADNDVPEGGPLPCQQFDAVGLRWLSGSQDPKIDVSFGEGAGGLAAQPGDPDYGLATRLDPNTSVRLDLHYINATSDVILREAWLQYDIVDEAEVVNLYDMITFFQSDISVPPNGSSVTGKAVCTAPTDRYLGIVTGHFHEGGDRFSVWKRDLAGNEVLVYETYNWSDPGNLYYRDGVQNALPNEAAGTHGGASGFQLVRAGESVVFQCAFSNSTNVTVGLGDQGRDQMCNVFGMYYPSDGNVWNCRCIGELCF